MAEHRAEQILQAAAAAIAAQTDVGAAVFPHRTLTVSALDQELPAVCVNAGPDTPLDTEDGYSNLAYIDSALRLDLSLYAQGSTQQDVATELMRLRSVVHRALLASPRDLSLAFVQAINYGGADKPVYTIDGSPLAGKLDCSFTILYRMNLTDPD